MREYLVTWIINVWADSPLEAAKKCRKYQIDPDTTATVFTCEDTVTGVSTQIDLLED